MKKLGLLAISVLFFSQLCFSQVVVRSFDIKNTTASDPLNVANIGLGAHIFTWSVQSGQLLTCTLSIESSAGVNGPFTQQYSGDCTGSSTSNYLIFTANFIRVRATTFSLLSTSALVTVNYAGYVIAPTSIATLTSNASINNQTTASSTLGTEMNSSPAGWTTGSNWTNNGAGLYTCAGTCGNLSKTGFSVTSGTIYSLTWTLGSNPSTCGSAYHFNLGAQVGDNHVYSCTDTGIASRAEVFKANTTASVSLTFIPGDFVGTIQSISIKPISTTWPARLVQTDANGSSLEIRSNSSVFNHGVGLNSLQYAINTVGADFGNTGSDLSASGYNALANVISGYKDVANGGYACYSLTTGFLDVCNGYKAGYSLTGGFRNVYEGPLAGFSTTYGYLNNCQGDECLYALTTGNNNVGSGASACQDATTSRFLTCIGVASLNLLITGNNHTGVGASSLQNTTGGSDCTGIGTGALQQANSDGTVPVTTTCDRSVALGENSGFYAKNSADQFFAGFFAGGDFLDGNNSNKKITGSDTHVTLIGNNTSKNSAFNLDDITCIGWHTFCDKSDQVALGDGSVLELYLFQQYRLGQDTRLTSGGIMITTVTNNSSFGMSLKPTGSNTETLHRLFNGPDENNAGWLALDLNNISASISANKAGTGTAPTNFSMQLPFQFFPTTYGSLPSPCNTANEGFTARLTNASSNTHGATVAGTGAFHATVQCDGSNYIVVVP